MKKIEGKGIKVKVNLFQVPKRLKGENIRLKIEESKGNKRE